MTLSQAVAEEIRVVLTRRRMSGRQLAAMLDVSQTWLSTRLNGTTPIDLNDLQRIAYVLDVDVIELLPPSRAVPVGRVLPTGTHHADDKGRGITIRKFGLTKRPRPNGHPKRTQPDPSTRRPARLSAGHA